MTIAKRLRLAALLTIAIVAASFASSVTARELGFGMTATARVTAVRYYAELQHNVADLAGTFTSGASYEAKFLSNFDRTGGVERWGFPTSAIFEETTGTLTQYYQRGVIDWQPPPGGGRHTFQRRLAWDHLGGGLGGSVDQGVEPGLRNPHPGEAIGPWGHKVANLSVEGVSTGFADFFHRLGGLASFGYPKTDARRDTHPQAVLHDPGRPVDSRIRQYFQAAVLEFHPESAVAPVKLRLLGDTLHNRKYPDNAWQQYPAFTSKPALNVGDDARLDLLAPNGTGAASGDVTAAVERLWPSLLRIETDWSCGSGFFVTANGYAVTAWHVVAGAQSVTITTTSGHRAAASVVTGDAAVDLALLAVDGLPTTAPVTWGDSATVPLGSPLVAMHYGATLTDAGITCGTDPTVTTGLLSSRVLGGNYLQTDVAINPGSSGGPVARLDGRVVGVVRSSLEHDLVQNTNFLIPSARAQPVIASWLDTLRRGGVLQPPPVPPEPPAGPSVLFASDHEECTGDADSVVAAAQGRGELTLTATAILHSREYPAIAELVLRRAHDTDSNSFDYVAIGSHILAGSPDDYLSQSWVRVAGNQRRIVATWAWGAIAAIDHDIPFDIRFTYNNGWVGFSINGEAVWVEEGLPYGPDASVGLGCNDWGEGGTVTYTNIRIEGFSL